MKLLLSLLMGLVLAAGATFAHAVSDKVSCDLTAPAAGTVVTAPGTLNLAATAVAKQNNRQIVQVDFFAGTTLIGTATTAPYAMSWTNVSAGTYALTCVATNDKGDTDTSPAVSVIVNAPPTATLTQPASTLVVAAPANITLAANAADADGTVAKVEFFYRAVGATTNTLIASVTQAPYTTQWTNVPPLAGRVFAVATDNRGATGNSNQVAFLINALPTVNLTAPAANAVFIAPATVNLAANAADTDGTVTKVEFFAGATLIGTVTQAPFAFSWTNAPAGSYAITAKATDDRNMSTTSVPVPITIDAPPTISLTAPVNNTVVAVGTPVTLTATASDSDGTIAKVEFFAGATLIATLTQAPFSTSWTPPAAGTYALTAKATDNQNAATTSAPVNLKVNGPPTIAITGPTNGATYTAPASVTLAVTVADADGTIAKVEYFAGGTLIASVTQAPFSYAWTNVAQGSYRLR